MMQYCNSLLVMAAMRGCCGGRCRHGDDRLRPGDHSHHPLVMVMMPALLFPAAAVLGLDVRHLPRVTAQGDATVPQGAFAVVYQAGKRRREWVFSGSLE